VKVIHRLPSIYIVYLFLGLDSLSGVAALLRFALPGIDDIEEDDVDIDDLINQEEEEHKARSEQGDSEGEESKDGGKKRKLHWDEE
jgi:hypothetical protein